MSIGLAVLLAVTFLCAGYALGRYVRGADVAYEAALDSLCGLYAARHTREVARHCVERQAEAEREKLERGAAPFRPDQSREGIRDRFRRELGREATDADWEVLKEEAGW